MGFICGKCHKPTPPRTPTASVVVETRKMQYRNFNADGEEIVSKGSEIVKEINCCPDCMVIIAATANAANAKAVKGMNR